jgi:hypothetical protein
MEPLFYMSAGAAGVVSLIIMKVGAAKAWAAVQAWTKARTSAAEADVKAKLDAAAAPFEARVRALERLVVKIAAKVGL